MRIAFNLNEDCREARVTMSELMEGVEDTSQ